MRSEEDILKVLESELSRFRFEHTLGVAGEAEKIAAIHGIDVKKARLAALLHDATKEFTVSKQLQMLAECGITVEEGMLDCPQILHAVSGSARAVCEFGASDDVASAIRWHATGRAGMKKLDMVIYLADLTEPTRRFAHDADTERLRMLAYTSLEAASAYEAQLTIERESQKGRVIWHDTLDTYHTYLPYLKKLEI